MNNGLTPTPEDNTEWAILIKDYQRLHEQRHLLEKELVELRGQVAWRNDAIAVQEHTINELMSQATDREAMACDVPLTDSIALLRAKLAVVMVAARNGLSAMELADKRKAGEMGSAYQVDKAAEVWIAAKKGLTWALAVARGESK